MNEPFSRLAGALLFVAMFWLASDCHGQRHRGLFRGLRAHQDTRDNEVVANSPLAAEQPTTAGQPSSGYQPLEAPGCYNWRRDPGFYSAYPNYPKYIGGFHSSNFNNLGVPSGDIGFRGNGIFWNPW